MIKKGRKQVYKEVLFKGFLNMVDKTEREIPETEFVEVVEKLSESKNNFEGLDLELALARYHYHQLLCRGDNTTDGVYRQLLHHAINRCS